LFGTAIAGYSAECAPQALAALNVPNLNVLTAATSSGYCRVTGTVTTRGEGAPDGSARFEVRLPDAWNGKFFFYGVGGLAGSIPGQPDAEGVVAKGYAMAVTDAGHQAGGTDARWALTAPGKPDRAKIADYYFRAAHAVTVAAKQLTAAYYGGKIQRSYFGGCSNGGRMALMEAQRYPEDFDGIISGAPFLDMRVLFNPIKIYKDAPPDFFIPPDTLAMVDKAIYARCDATDGVKDGLIQNPSKCSFTPDSLLCKDGNGADCLTPGQVEVMKRYWGPIRDSRGQIVVLGMAPTDVGGQGGVAAWTTGAIAPADIAQPDPWNGGGPAGWQFSSHIIQNLVQYDPSYAARKFDVSPAGVIGEAALRLFDQRTSDGSPRDAARLRPFIRQDRKLLMYHGFSDPALSPYRTMLFYEQLSGLNPGIEKNVRLFMVPGMQHCSGGPGPDVFDTVTALDNWVTKGVAPNRMMATKFQGRRTGAVLRTMPLCKYPEQARYQGAGDINDGANWSCAAQPGLLESGAVGSAAGWK
jgi:feruloyl esterase